MAEDEYQVCYKHPDRRTLLRCNKCDKPICLECAVQTPTGYRCKDCVKAQQKVFDTSQGKDYLIGGAIAAGLGYVGSYVDLMIPLLPSFLTALTVGSIFGRLICSVVRNAVQRRRSRQLTIIITTAAGIGGLVPRFPLIRQYLAAFPSGSFLSGLTGLIICLLYIIVLCMTIWNESSGMIFGRRS